MKWVDFILSLFRQVPATSQDTPTPIAPASRPLAWGARVSDEFGAKVRAIATELQIQPDWLMGCMAFESSETFSASVRNPGSSATGLIQFMESTARQMNTTTAALAALTAVEQLDYVLRYFKPQAGRLHNLGDVYMAILWPAGIGRADEWVLWDSRDSKAAQAYRANKGLDLNADGFITRAEAVALVAAKTAKGQRLENAR